jgi:hypothetical protein
MQQFGVVLHCCYLRMFSNTLSIKSRTQTHLEYLGLLHGLTEAWSCLYLQHGQQHGGVLHCCHLEMPLDTMSKITTVHAHRKYLGLLYIVAEA